MQSKFYLLAFSKTLSLKLGKKFLLNLLLIFSTFLCFHTISAQVDNTSVSQKKLKILTTFTILQDIAQNIAGDAATVISLTKPGADIHNYQPTPKDIVKAKNADLLLFNGFNLEKGFERFFIELKDMPTIIATENITPIQISEGEYKNNPNPHAWMSPSNALIYIENIRKGLVQHDPVNAEIYNENARQYSEKINHLDQKLRQRLANISLKQRWLVSSEGAFSYLVKDYNFKEAYIFPINSETQGSAQQIRKVIDIVKQYEIPVVFSESTLSPKPAQQISKETNAKYGGILYVDTLSSVTGPVPTYLELLSVTIDTVAKGFEQ